MMKIPQFRELQRTSNNGYSQLIEGQLYKENLDQTRLELVLKSRASIEQETLGRCGKMREAITYNQQTNEDDFNKRLEKLELWSKAGCDLAETSQIQIVENKHIPAQASNSAQARAEEMYKQFAQRHWGK